MKVVILHEFGEGFAFDATPEAFAALASAVPVKAIDYSSRNGIEETDKKTEIIYAKTIQAKPQDDTGD